MLTLLIWLFVGFSATNIIVFQHVFLWLRKAVSGIDDEQFKLFAKYRSLAGFRRSFLGRLFRCHTCMGFWIGILAYHLGAYSFIRNIVSCEIAGYICSGLLQSVFNTILWLLLLKIGIEKL